MQESVAREKAADLKTCRFFPQPRPSSPKEMQRHHTPTLARRQASFQLHALSRRPARKDIRGIRRIRNRRTVRDMDNITHGIRILAVLQLVRHARQPDDLRDTHLELGALPLDLDDHPRHVYPQKTRFSRKRAQLQPKYTQKGRKARKWAQIPRFRGKKSDLGPKRAEKQIQGSETTGKSKRKGRSAKREPSHLSDLPQCKGRRHGSKGIVQAKAKKKKWGAGGIRSRVVAVVESVGRGKRRGEVTISPTDVNVKEIGQMLTILPSPKTSHLWYDRIIGEALACARTYTRTGACTRVRVGV